MVRLSEGIFSFHFFHFLLPTSTILRVCNLISDCTLANLKLGIVFLPKCVIIDQKLDKLLHVLTLGIVAAGIAGPRERFGAKKKKEPLDGAEPIPPS